MPRLSSRAFGASALLLLLGASACTGAATTLRTGAPGPAPAPAAATQPAGAATSAVRYLGAVVDVPAGWPVYDLSADPGRCARMDVHAVYLGHQGPDASCPAHLVGKTEAVQIQPLDAASRDHLAPSGATRDVVNGVAADVQPGSTASHDIVASYPSLGVVVTASFAADRSKAQAIVASVRAAGR